MKFLQVNIIQRKLDAGTLRLFMKTFLGNLWRKPCSVVSLFSIERNYKKFSIESMDFSPLFCQLRESRNSQQCPRWLFSVVVNRNKWVSDDNSGNPNAITTQRFFVSDLRFLTCTSKYFSLKTARSFVLSVFWKTSCKIFSKSKNFRYIDYSDLTFKFHQNNYEKINLSSFYNYNNS